MRALRVVLSWVDRLVVPWPSNWDCVEVLARLFRAPAALLGPPGALIELFRLDWRCVLVAPCTTAEAFSATTIVMRSSSWAARMSLPSAVSREPGDHREPGVAWTLGDLPWLMASWMYRSRGLNSADFLLFSAATKVP